MMDPKKKKKRLFEQRPAEKGRIELNKRKAHLNVLFRRRHGNAKSLGTRIQIETHTSTR
jgi:hypothetical protein